MARYSVQGVELHVEDRGIGTPLLLVHGFPLDHSMWRHQIEDLSRNYRVIAPDMRGFGKSGATPGTVTMREFATDLSALLLAMRISEPVVLCGLSMGGYIAFQFAEHYRDQLRALILCDTKAAADSEEARQTRYKMADLVTRSGTGILAESMPAKLFAAGHLGSELDLQTRDVIRRANPLGVAAAQLGMAARPDVTARLSAIDVPTLVIVGDEDVITPPAEMNSMAEKIPGARFVSIPGAGHMAPLENPGLVNAAMREFLGTL
jgi:pimeloyl-ACP methyl ester carboxylesterase